MNKIVWPGWKTIGMIGRGGFGEVYEVERDVAGLEKAAVKRISIPQDDGEIEELYASGYDDVSLQKHFNDYLQEFLKEYRLMADLKGNTNIVSCDDVRYEQHDDGIGWDIYIRMELLIPLMKVLDHIDTEEQVIKVGRDICNALVLCRSRNIVHRDIKPQNIFVSKNGDYKLGDFGIAKTMEKTSGATKIGTYEYMAPEVYHGQPYGSAADIYSLGMVLYWLLNERRGPFNALPPNVPTGLEREQARERRFRGEQIPEPVHGGEELKRIILKACSFDPKNRFASAKEMLDDLDSVATSRPSYIRKKDATVSEDSGGSKTEKIRENITKADITTGDKTVGIVDRSKAGNGSEGLKTIRTTPIKEKKTIKATNKSETKPVRIDLVNKNNSKQGEETIYTDAISERKKKILLTGVIGGILLIALVFIILVLLKKDDSQDKVKIAYNVEPTAVLTEDVSLEGTKGNAESADQLTDVSILEPAFPPAASSVPQLSETIVPNTTNDLIPFVRTKLVNLGYMKMPELNDLVYDQATVNAVKRFQYRNFPDDVNAWDGYLGTKTFDQLLAENAVEFCIKIGDTDKKLYDGELVTALQHQLIAEGYLKSATGIFDKATEEAVRVFQKANSLPSDGIADLSTLKLLEQMTLEARAEGTAEKPDINEEIITQLQNAAVGDSVIFGSYEQDNEISNGKESIEWIVLEKADGEAKLITKYIIDALPFNENQTHGQKKDGSYYYTYWAQCSLHSWLNETFFNEAFDSNEKSIILKKTVKAEKNSAPFDYGAGPDTSDYVHILSIKEVQKYFPKISDRVAEKTLYAKYGNGKPENMADKNWWWLRNPGMYPYCAAVVLSKGGYEEEKGNWIGRGAGNYGGVRPVICIRFSN